MKRRIIDKDGKIIREWNERDPLHISSIQKNPSAIYKNKKKYTRKIKHKKLQDEYLDREE